ncbi:alpha/beta hydrolase fold domain-containing protein [Actinomadura citrea]|uniref:alpha/beta hydrolase fold domain-containing protein n=1 Tax=Actinomadura citrea TaxID=46158 RepID=UPI003CE4BFC9
MSEEGNVLEMSSAPEAIEFRHLRAFVAVAEDLNFSRAADRLFISQPALSRQIRALERLIGCALFRRSTQRVELTLSGEALLAQARPLLADLADAITTARSVGGELAGRTVRLWKPWMDASVGITDLEANRAAVEDLHSRFAPPEGVSVVPIVAGGVPALRVAPRDPTTGKTVLFVHGGGHISGSAYGYRHFAGAIAAASHASVLAVDYRLAPEHPFPASLDDTLSAYTWLLDTGVRADALTVVGDSSGGGLVLSLLLGLRERGLPLPAGAALMCPWLDLSGRTQSGPAGGAHAPSVAMARHFAALYLAGHPAGDPLVDPLNADLRGLPPLLVQTASGEFTRQEAQLLAKRARAQGVDVTATVYPVEAHDFPIFWTFLPDAATALTELAHFVHSVTCGEHPQTGAREAK